MKSICSAFLDPTRRDQYKYAKKVTQNEERKNFETFKSRQRIRIEHKEMLF
jgi:hypothetical protein